MLQKLCAKKGTHIFALLALKAEHGIIASFWQLKFKTLLLSYVGFNCHRHTARPLFAALQLEAVRLSAAINTLTFDVLGDASCN